VFGGHLSTKRDAPRWSHISGQRVELALTKALAWQFCTKGCIDLSFKSGSSEDLDGRDDSGWHLRKANLH
jgi:hypothetical protein